MPREMTYYLEGRGLNYKSCAKSPTIINTTCVPPFPLLLHLQPLLSFHLPSGPRLIPISTYQSFPNFALAVVI